jgi:tetratricopeptide (TPR) repeat protein
MGGAAVGRCSSGDLQAAYALHQAGLPADAARAYRELLQRFPDDPDVLHLFGVLHHQSGHHTRACELIARAIELRPGTADFHVNLSEAQRAAGRFDEAVASSRAALALRSDFAEAHNNLGLALHELGRNDEAVATFDAALALRPDFALAANNRGSALRALGKTAEAVEAYRAAVALDHTLARAHANLGQMLADQGKLLEALTHCRDAVRHQPDLAAGHNNLGNVLRGLERWVEAADAYSEAVRLEPDLGVAHTNVGLALQNQGKPALAVPHFRRAAELAPEDPAGWQKLAAAHGLEEDWSAAVGACERRVALSPQDADAHNDLGWAFQSDDRPAEAQAAYRRALELAPNHLDAWINLGSLHEEVGAMSEAEDCYRQARERHPFAPAPLSRRAVLLRGRLEEADRDRLRYELYRPCGPAVRMNLLYALAQVADGRGDYAEAAACLGPANALARELRRGRGQTYDADEHSRYVDRLIAGFTPDLFERLRGTGDDSARPVFVFGLPRSGTTLVEQVLASHSQVFGAGELPFAHKGLKSLGGAAAQPEDLPACLAALDADTVRKLSAAYRQGVDDVLGRNPVGPCPARVVDKMPDNYLTLGLIALMFPRATLIQVRRDPRDVAVSCWMTHFRSIPWADDQGDLARRFADYRRMMAHWREVLPVPLHEMDYECLVDDFETQAQRLTSVCGLCWEQACLRFHQTHRSVRTASVTQVRQPLYRKSVGRWKAYKPYLGGLFDRLIDGA